MIRLEWMSGHQSLRILMLPEEYYCPGLQYVQENGHACRVAHVVEGHAARGAWALPLQGRACARIYATPLAAAHRWTIPSAHDTIRSAQIGDPGRRTSNDRRGFSGTLGRVTMQSVH